AAMYLSRVIPVYVKQCRAIVTKMALNSKWQGPLLAQATAHIDALEKAESNTHRGSPADTGIRNDALALVQSDMPQLKAMVQATANSDPANAESIIESAGMSVVKRVVKPKPPLAARQGKVPGAGDLAAKQVKGALIYEWQMSTNQTDWTDLP